MKHRLFFLIFFISALSSLNAEPNIIVEHYTVEEGLPNNMVNCTLKDSDGFIWFGTWYGLCSFDGVKFKTYNNRDELFDSPTPPRKIQKIAEDKNGFLWINTIEGKLYLFDRRNGHFLPIYDNVKKYAENTQIINIQNTSDGEVLLLTKDKNLLRASCKGKDEVNIQRLFDSNPYVDTYNSHLKHNVFGETQEYLNWIGMDDKILSYRKGKNVVDKPANFLFAKTEVTSPEIFTYASGNNTHVWVGDNAGRIYCINPDLGSVNKYELPDIKKAIKNILVINDNIVYICVSGQGVYEYNIPKDQLQKLSIDINAEEVLHSFMDKHNKIWFEEGEKALVYYDPLNKTDKRFYLPQGQSIGNWEVQDAGEQGLFFLTPAGEMLMFERESLSMIRMNLLKQFADVPSDRFFVNQMLDKDGILWLSSTTSGVYRINFPPKQFRLFDPQTFTKTPHTEKDASSIGIKALYQTKNGDIWIGTRWSGLYQLDRNGKLKQVFSASNYPVGNVSHSMEDKNGNLWFSTKGSGLVKAIPDPHVPYGFRFVRYSNNPNVLSSLAGNDVCFTFQDSKDRIWVGVSGGGLNLLQENDNGVSFKHKYNGFKQYPSYGLYMEVRNMTEDKGRIWIGTTDGLMSFDINFNVPEDIIFETYRDQNLSGGISDNDMYVLYKDTDSQIWMSAFGGGLNKLTGYDEEKREPVLKPYGIREGLNNGVVMSIVEDDAGSLWFVTESGISRFDKQTERFRNYDKYDGFPDVTTEEGAALKTIGNELWLGCKQGILVFSPNKLQSYHHDYATCIVDLKIANTDVRSFKEKTTTKESGTYTGEVRLQHEQSTFTIEFAALNYYNQNRVSYKYMLEGYEKEWHVNGKNRIASYTNVPPGKYKFRVQSLDEANPELISGRTLAITVLPPWWLNGWAYTVYLLAGIGLLILAWKVILFILKRKNDVYINQRLLELKITFFTTVSSELHTPLMLIKDIFRELKEKENLSPKGKWYVKLTEKNTNQMLQLVNQILDFKKTQNEKMHLTVSLIDLNEIMNSFYKEFRIWSQENEVTYSFHLTNDVIMLWADKEKLHSAIRNIISNAFQFTSSGKNITVSTGIAQNGKKCYIRIENSDVGIQENKISNIFERFSPGDKMWNPYHQGTGVGLALSQELINLHHGSIVVKNRENQGTVFTVELVLGKKHFKNSEVTFCMEDTEEKPQLQPATTIPVLNGQPIGSGIAENTLPLFIDNKELEKRDILFLEKIHRVIEENLNNSELNMDDIAAHIGLSRPAFFKKLKSLTGFAPVDLIKEIRLNKSVELIQNTNKHISEIAFTVGFKDSGYYTKCFRKKYHKTPTEYRNDRIY